jgi:putative tryptophan/tyrosine transport system substrate-binding protein
MQRDRLRVVRGLLLLIAMASLAVGAHAQPVKRLPTVGVLWPNPPATFDFVRRGLSELGYVENRSIAFEYRWAENRLGELPQLAAELVAKKVDVIVTLAPPATIAAKNATSTIPIVFVAIGDPVASGLVSNLARPGGNLTGTTRMLSEMSVKHVEFLKQAVPGLARLAILWNPANSSHAPALRASESVARSLGVRTQALEVRAPADLESVFATIRKDGTDGMLFLADPIFFIHLRRMAELVSAARLPTVSNFTEFAKLGGLIGYSPSIAAEFRRAATHVDRILRGTKPGDLAIQQPDQFELVINLRTARTLGLTIPPALLQRADHVID